jgi:hypothetical protein
MAGKIWGGDQRPPDEKERSALMDADVVALRRKRITWDEIGQIMADKYRTDSDEPYRKQTMYKRWKAAIAAVPAKEVLAHRAELNELLDELIDQANVIMRKDHLAHSNGRVVELHGEPVIDDGPKLAAMAEMRKLVGEIRQLNGLTVPVKQEVGVDATVSYTINGVDVGKLT